MELQQGGRRSHRSGLQSRRPLHLPQHRISRVQYRPDNHSHPTVPEDRKKTCEDSSIKHNKLLLRLQQPRKSRKICLDNNSGTAEEENGEVQVRTSPRQVRDHLRTSDRPARSIPEEVLFVNLLARLEQCSKAPMEDSSRHQALSALLLQLLRFLPSQTFLLSLELLQTHLSTLLLDLYDIFQILNELHNADDPHLLLHETTNRFLALRPLNTSHLPSLPRFLLQHLSNRSLLSSIDLLRSQSPISHLRQNLRKPMPHRSKRSKRRTTFREGLVSDTRPMRFRR